MKKKIVSGILILAMLLSVAGCEAENLFCRNKQNIRNYINKTFENTLTNVTVVTCTGVTDGLYFNRNRKRIE